MRTTFSERVERGRMLDGPLASSLGDDFGAFNLRTNGGAALKIIASSGYASSGYVVPWEHVSVSTKTRCPTWEEMCWVKKLFFEDEETVVQFHVPVSEHVNYHPYCLHLWRPRDHEIARPPAILVGPQPLQVSP